MRLAEPELEAFAMRADAVPASDSQVCGSCRKHRLIILVAFAPMPIAVEAENDAEVFSTNSRERSMGNIPRLGYGNASAKATCENSTVWGEF